MPSIFFPNLMFEEQLGGIPVSGSAYRRIRELSVLMSLLVDSPEDVVLADEDAIPGELPEALSGVRFMPESALSEILTEGFRLCPWGQNNVARKTAERLRIQYDAPDEVIVAAVNSRRFLHPFDLVIPWDGDLTSLPATAGWRHREADRRLSFPHGAVWREQLMAPFSRLCDELAEVRAAVRSFGGTEWCIKAEWSQAGRNRIRAAGSALSDAHCQWLEKQFARGQSVALEPWVRCIAECGLQFRIAKPAESIFADAETGRPKGNIAFDGLAPFVNTSGGRFVGSILFSDAAGDSLAGVWKPAVEHGRRIAEAASDLGFFGFLGIDCMLFEGAEGQVFLRLSHDVNARITMGRIALRLRKWLQPEELGFWAHFPVVLDERRLFSFANLPENSVRIVHTTPGTIGGCRPQMRSALFATPDRSALDRLISEITKLNAGRNG